MKRSGTADLPLHGGRVPAWLAALGPRTLQMSVFSAILENVETQFEPTADFDAAVAHERSISRSIGGRTVQDDRRVSRDTKQRSLF